jgi:hypothetical protein
MRAIILILGLLGAIRSAVVKPVVGIVPFEVPIEIWREIGDNKQYVSAATSKWLETFRTRWVPLDWEGENRDEALEKINGILLMGEKEEWSRTELIDTYVQRIKKIVQVVEKINEKRYFPLIAIGFGAHLLLKVLGHDHYRPVVLPLKKKLIDYKFLDTDSTFKTFAGDNIDRFDAKYPNLGEHFVLLDDFTEDKPLGQGFKVIAKTKAEVAGKVTETVGFYEHRRLPIFGLFSDYQTVHFSHGLIDGAAFDDKSLDIGFELAEFWSNILQKGKVSAPQQFVTDMKSGWKRFASRKHMAQFEEIYVSDL